MPESVPASNSDDAGCGGAARREPCRAEDVRHPDGVEHQSPPRRAAPRFSDLVLVVDDEPDLRELLAEALEDAGYEVTVAENGLAALRAAEREHPALVLTDCTMPGLDGPALVRRLRSQPATSHIPVIAMSATRTAREALDDVPFILKPFDVDDVLSTIERHTRRRGRAGHLTASSYAS